MLATFFTRPLELMLNRGLDQSTTAQALAAGLEGRTLGFTVEGTPFDVRLAVINGRMRVTLPDDHAPDATVRGGALSLGRLLREDAQSLIRDGAVKMSGDTEVAERFRELLRHAMPDLEEELSRLVGDPLARQAGNVARSLSEWGESAGRSIERSLAEYLQEESRVLPTPGQVRTFAREVDTLSHDVERAEARVARLEQDR